MLSSTPSSLLLSTALPALNAGGAQGEASAMGVPGFAELLSSLSTKTGSGVPGETLVADEPKLPTATDAALAKAAKASETAILDKAAIATGKILPVSLPEAAEVADTEPSVTAIDPLAVLAAAGLLQQQSLTANKSQPGAATVEPGKTALPQAAAFASAAKPVAKTREGQAADARTPPAVAISVASEAEASSASAPNPTAAAETATIAPKAHRAELRAEAPLPPVAQPSQAVTTVADAAPAPSGQPVPATSAPAAMAAPADINAALDRLVAAREALMPAEAALSLDHAEFGEVSIRFEQGSDGRLSAELRAADPELQRAVTAAVGADRGLSMGSEGDSRPTNLANQRGASAGSDAGAGERGHTGERDMNRRHGNGRPAAHEGKNDPRPGVFA